MRKGRSVKAALFPLFTIRFEGIGAVNGALSENQTNG